MRGLPSLLAGNQFSGTLTNAKDCDHGIDGGHFGKDAGVGNTQVLDAANPQLGINDGIFVFGHVTHLRGTGGVIDGVCNATSVLANLLVCLNFGARGNFFLEPFLEGACLGNLTSSLDTSNQGGGIVALGVGEVPKVQGRLHGRVGRGEEDAATRPGTGDVWGHAKGVAILDDWIA